MELKNLDKALGKSVTMILDKMSKFVALFTAESRKNEENVKGLEILVKSVSSDIAKLHNQDYSERFKSIEEKIVGKNFASEKDDIIKEVRSIISSIKDIELKTEVKTEAVDTSKMELLLEKISNKNISFPDFEFKDINGNKYLKVYVDRTGSGLNTVHLFDVRGNTINPATSENQTNGEQKTQIVNTAGTPINPATEEKQDPTAGYQLANYDVSASPIYIGKVDSGGGWMIKQIDTSTGIALYFKGDTDYATSWSNRAGLSYDSFDNIF